MRLGVRKKCYSHIFLWGIMKSNRLHNELYKLAIEMHKYNNKGVKHNLDYLLSQASIRNNERNNSVQLSFSDTLQKK
jgi:hypothetical protein